MVASLTAPGSRWWIRSSWGLDHGSGVAGALAEGFGGGVVAPAPAAGGLAGVSIGPTGLGGLDSSAIGLDTSQKASVFTSKCLILAYLRKNCQLGRVPGTVQVHRIPPAGLKGVSAGTHEEMTALLGEDVLSATRRLPGLRGADHGCVAPLSPPASPGEEPLCLSYCGHSQGNLPGFPANYWRAGTPCRRARC